MSVLTLQHKILAGMSILLILCGCSSKTPTENDYSWWQAKFNEYDIVQLSFENRFLYWPDPISLNLDFPHDRDGIIITYFNGQYVYHPFSLTNMALRYISGYYVTHDSAYLDFSYRYARKLSELGVRDGNGIYFPYTFNYVLHSSNDMMMAPWYSGMAQGYALSFFSKLYELTGDYSIKALADSVFNTFLHTDTSNPIWTCVVDSLDYYWIEEYPYQPYDHVLGGFTSGIIGLHNYYMIDRDKRCEILLKSAFTTIEYYFGQFRNPGEICNYCLLHRLQLGQYHIYNTDRMRYMAIISGSPVFDAFADSLAADYSG